MAGADRARHMNRRARRAALAGAKAASAHDAASIADLMVQADRHYQRGEIDKTRVICDRILSREPAHVNALNLSGLVLQASGSHRLAVNALTKAVAGDPTNAACHYNLASSLEALGRRDEAAAHFKRAIALGSRFKNTEDLILRNPAITTTIDQIEESWPLPVKPDLMFARYSLQSIAGDLFLRCALETVPLHHPSLEKFLTVIRAALLRLAVDDPDATGDVVRLMCAMAQQCFVNEYALAQSEEEVQLASRLRDALLQKIASGDAIAPPLLAAVAAYSPLHELPGAAALLTRQWPDGAADVIRQQLREPLAEIENRQAIPSLTAVDDAVSLLVMNQYEENPYPRWTVPPVPMAAAADQMGGVCEVLIAGCGSGQHVFDVAQRFPGARILAVDLSLPSLAYARRKAHEAGLRNVDYARADILKLVSLGRSFNRIEAVGVLHHLADPELGWRNLLAMLQPQGHMRVGLYSEAGRRRLAPIRAFIAESGYTATADDIRKFRQDILRDADQTRWRPAIEAADFYSISGCRDLLFHVMEHRFSIPRIKTFLDANALCFLGFDADPLMIGRFQQRFPGGEALTDLDKWHIFEGENPQIFQRMYVFTVQKK